MTFTSDGGEITLLVGINAIVRDKDGKLTIENIPPKASLSKEYKDVDLKVNDVIFMCNGKSIKTIDDLNKAMEAVEVGADLSFGIKRDKDRLIATMPKADQNAGGKMMVMTQTIGGDDGTEEEMSISSGGEMLQDVTFLSCGLIIKDIDGQTSVVAILPTFKSNNDGQKPKDGDILVSINGQKANSSKEFSKAFDKIKVGDNVIFSFTSGDKSFDVEIIKEEQPEGEVIIKKG